jgi:PAS domain S-box-containing protein
MNRSIRKVASWLDRWPGPLQDAVAVLAVGLIGLADYLTGPEIAVFPLYLIPISLAAWRRGVRTGLLVSIAGTVAWLIALLLPAYNSHMMIAYWNALTRLAVFVTIALLFARVRVLTESLRQAVAEKSRALVTEKQEHRLTRDVLQSTEEQFRILVEGVRECAIFMLDLDGTITSWNRGAEALTGYRAHEVLHQHFSIFWPAEEPRHDLARQVIAKALQDGAMEDEGWRIRRNGTRFWANTMLTVLHDPAGHARGFSKIMADTTGRKRLEDELLAKEEGERQRIGRDLHDVLGQDLAALALLSKDLEETLLATAGPEAVMAGRVCQYACEAVDQVRRLAQGLCPPELQGDGLIAILEELARRTVEVFGIRCQVHCSGPVQFENAATGLHLYRIAQEATGNAVRHGQAQDITIHLSRMDDRIILKIEDSGSGLPEEPFRGRGMGISTMKHRARMIGGYLLLQPRSPSGTVVICSLPVQPREPDDSVGGEL